MLFPVAAGRLSRDSMGDPREGHGHAGQDIPAPWNSPIRAAMPGVVSAIHTDPRRACGYGVSLDDSARIRWTYCHMKRAPNLQLGQRIEQGDFLGLVGSTGSSTGPHLHLQAITELGEGDPINLFWPLRNARDTPPESIARSWGQGPLISGLDEPPPSPLTLALEDRIRRLREAGADNRDPELRATARRYQRAVMGEIAIPTLTLTAPQIGALITQLSTLVSQWEWPQSAIDAMLDYPRPNDARRRMQTAREAARDNVLEVLRASRATLPTDQGFAQELYYRAARRWENFTHQAARMAGEIVADTPGWGDTVQLALQDVSDSAGNVQAALTPGAGAAALAALALGAWLLMR